MTVDSPWVIIVPILATVVPLALGGIVTFAMMYANHKSMRDQLNRIDMRIEAMQQELAGLRADYRSLEQWVKRIDAGLDEHVSHHPGPTSHHGDD